MAGILDHTFPSLSEAREIQRFWEDHYRELLEQYPDRFVAVQDGAVIATDSDLEVLVRGLRERGIDPRADVAIEFISTQADRLVL